MPDEFQRKFFELLFILVPLVVFLILFFISEKSKKK